MLGQLMDDNLYPSIDPPVFRNGSQNILEDALTLSPGSPLRLVNPNSGSAGSIYYTLDGTDPRADRGERERLGPGRGRRQRTHDFLQHGSEGEGEERRRVERAARNSPEHGAGVEAD